MSGQWETVTRKKGANVNGKPTNGKLTKESQKVPLNKAADLPLSDLVDLYSKNTKNKENRKPQQESNSKPQNTNQKVNNTKQKPPKSNEVQKPKVFKSIETAFMEIKAENLKKILEDNQKLYPSTPIVWLRELAEYLNIHLNVEKQDPIFANKPWNYPLCAMPSALRSVLETALKQAGTDNTTVFFDICLACMAMSMNKNHVALGHKLFLQLLPQIDPDFAINIKKVESLLNSYKNRPNIGQSILWALGQVGYKNFNLGLKIFQEIMLLLIDLKSYTNHIFKYVLNILKHHQKKASINKTMYFTIIDVLYNRKTISNDLNKEIMPLCNNLLLASNDKRHTLIEPLLRKANQSNNKSCKNYINDVLAKCVTSNKTCVETWKGLYLDNLVASSSLIYYIEQSWDSLSESLNKELLDDLFSSFSEMNEELSKKKKKVDGLLDCMIAIKRVKTKMANTKKKGCTKCRYFTYFVFILASAAIYCDVQQHGGWNNSCTSRALNNTGVYDYSNKAYGHAKEGTLWVHDKVETAFPGVTGNVVDFASSYVELGKDLGIILKNGVNNVQEVVMEKVPVVVDTIESYAPGTIEAAQSVGSSVCSTVSNYYNKSKEFLMTDVFVGKLAPEEMQKTIVLSLETGGQKVQEYYRWIYNKVTASM